MTDTTPPETALPPPFILRRLMALLYDTLLVLPIIMLNVALALGLQSALITLAGGDPEQAALHPYLVQALAAVTASLFFGIFWVKSGQTLGMQAWRLKLVSVDGGPVSAMACVRRCLGAMISAGCLGLGYLWCLVDRNGRYWHDYFSTTELQLQPKTKGEKDASKGG